ncbi:MAG: hypothetical protein JEZ10_03880 [Verrucomicrobia bacterium]|nr:hypothetical protein [Verrucomicrobiota bacterium]
MKLLKVTPLTDAGNIRAFVEVETPAGETITCRIIKTKGFRAYLDTQPHTLTHKEKRHLQREAVTAWGNMISDTLEGLLLSEKVFRGSRFHRLGVQLKSFCPVCDRVTPTEVSETPGGHFRNACYFCGTLRKGRPFISCAEAERIQELNARECKGVFHEQLD